MLEDRLFSEGAWTQDRLLHVFNTELSVNRRGQPSEYISLCTCLQEGSIAYEEQRFRCKPAPSAPKRGEAESPDWKHFKRCSRGGSHLHGWLKWWSYHWLLEQSGIEPLLEKTVAGYGRPDLQLPDFSVVVECGNTSPGHALRYLAKHPAGNFVVVPFQRAALENMGRTCQRTLYALVLRKALTSHST